MPETKKKTLLWIALGCTALLLLGIVIGELILLRIRATTAPGTTATTQPGLQIYTSNFMSERKGKGGKTYNKRDAICLETQHFPDAVHHDNFPSVILKKGEAYHQETRYTFHVSK